MGLRPNTINYRAPVPAVTGIAPTVLPTMGIAMVDGTTDIVINTAVNLAATKAMAA